MDYRYLPLFHVLHKKPYQKLVLESMGEPASGVGET